MARERWFYVESGRRMGPLSLQKLVESLLVLPNPRSFLVWHRSLPAWTRAGEVRQLAAQLPVVAEPAVAPPAGPAPWPGPGEPGAYREEAGAEATAAATAPKAVSLLRQPRGLLAAAAACVLLAIGIWGVWLRAPEGEAPAASGTERATRPVGTPASQQPGPAPSTAGPGPASRPDAEAAFSGWEQQESVLPIGELSKLRGVAAWRGEKLTVTLYNGSTWRITELLVRVSRLQGDTFVDDPSPARLVAISGEIGADVAQLLNKVAPDRSKPGVNPLDTGALAGDSGARPDAYRWSIEGAMGYAPRIGR